MKFLLRELLCAVRGHRWAETSICPCGMHSMGYPFLRCTYCRKSQGLR